MISLLLVGALRAAQLVPAALAQATGGAGGNIDTHQQQSYTLPNPLGTDNFLDIINRILQGLTIIAIPIVAILVVVGGLKLITGRGKPESLKSAKDMILWAAIGFGVLLLADSVALIVQNFLSSPTTP